MYEVLLFGCDGRRADDGGVDGGVQKQADDGGVQKQAGDGGVDGGVQKQCRRWRRAVAGRRRRRAEADREGRLCIRRSCPGHDVNVI